MDDDLKKDFGELDEYISESQRHEELLSAIRQLTKSLASNKYGNNDLILMELKNIMQQINLKINEQQKEIKIPPFPQLPVPQVTVDNSEIAEMIKEFIKNESKPLEWEFIIIRSLTGEIQSVKAKAK